MSPSDPDADADAHGDADTEANADHEADRADTDDLDLFTALFSEELEELTAIADDQGIALRDVSRAYFVIVRGDSPMVSHRELQRELGVDGPTAWATASVLVDFGEVYRSKDTDWWWIVASGFLAELCEKRSISLKRYLEMEPVLYDFQDHVTRWYEVRHMHGNLQKRTLRSIKLEYCQRLQKQQYPDKPLDPDNFHDHQISRYVKTAQDVIVEAMNLSY